MQSTVRQFLCKSGRAVIRDKLGQVRSVLAEMDTEIARRFLYNSALVSGDFCMLALDGTTAELRDWKLIVNARVEKNGVGVAFVLWSFSVCVWGTCPRSMGAGTDSRAASTRGTSGC